MSDQGGLPSATRRRMEESAGDALTDLLVRSPAASLLPVLDNPHLEESQLTLVLRRQDLSTEFLTRLGDHRRWMASYLVKAAMVAHPRTPKPMAMGLVKFLFWRDLARLVGNHGADPVVRRVAEVTLRDRLHEISLGERIALARLAPREVIKALRRESDERVMAALLDNPRMTEEDVVIITMSPRTPPGILALVARSDRWVARRSIRGAVVRNPRTPARNALPLLSGLAEVDIRGVADTPTVPNVVRTAARRYLAGRNAPGK